MVIKKGIQLNNRKLVNTILYAGDQILMATSEDDLQTMAYHLNLIARKYKITISSTKTKAVAMWGNHIQRVKTVINDNIIEQVTDFKYLGYRISEYKSDLVDKLQTYKKSAELSTTLSSNNFDFTAIKPRYYTYFSMAFSIIVYPLPV